MIEFRLMTNLVTGKIVQKSLKWRKKIYVKAGCQQHNNKFSL